MGLSNLTFHRVPKTEDRGRRLLSKTARERKSSQITAKKKSDNQYWEGREHTYKGLFYSRLQTATVIPEIVTLHTSPEPYIGLIKINPSVSLFSSSLPYDIACAAYKICRESPRNFLLKTPMCLLPGHSSCKTTVPSLPI